MATFRHYFGNSYWKSQKRAFGMLLQKRSKESAPCYLRKNYNELDANLLLTFKKGAL